MKIRKISSVVIAAVFIFAALSASASATVPVVTPVISSAPGNLQWPEDSLASYQCVCENDTGHDKFTYEWHIIYNDVDYKVGGGFTDPWCAHVNTKSANTGLVGNAIFLDGIQHGLNGAGIYCKVIGSNAAVSTPVSTIFIIDPGKFTPPQITSPVYVECEKGDKVDLTVKGTTTAGNVDLFRDYISYHWYLSKNGTVNDMEPIETGKDIYKNNVYTVDTSVTGTFYYVCGVFDGVENQNMCNRSYTNVITVTVKEKQVVEVAPPTITQQPTGDELTFNELAALVVEAKAPEGCTVGYQWYTSDKNSHADMEQMAGETAYALKVPQIEGDRYYCCTVWSIDKDGNMSTVVPSDIVKITYKKAETADTTVPDTETETETEKVTETENDTVTKAEPINTDDLVPTGTEAHEGGETGNTAQTGTAAETNVPAAATAETDNTKTEKSAVSGIVIALIIVAALLFCALVAVTVIMIVHTKKQNKNK